MAGDVSFVTALYRAPDAGDAVLPLDQRLLPPAKTRLLALRSAVVVSADGTEMGHTAPPTLAELRQLGRGELGAVAAPKELVVKTSPRTAPGRVRRHPAQGPVADGEVGR
jgi:hypothetical protein